jgi:hypothetical protein
VVGELVGGGAKNQEDEVKVEFGRMGVSHFYRD